MIRSLKKKDGFHPLLKEYGQVFLDECQHGASDSAIEVLQEIPARYVYGVTATPKRGDGKEKINEFLLGSVRYRYTAKDRAKEQNIDHLVYPRFTRTVSPHHLAKMPYGNDAYELIRNNDVRDEQIIQDVKNCVMSGRTPVVLTKYVDHAKKLSERLRKYADRLILLTGADGTKARRAQVQELNEVEESESLILVGTGSLLGEGFDFPRLDTLFMATPVSGESVVEQYVGRLNRDYEGKENVIVYDYVDSHVPKFDKMYAARLKAYKKIGYELCAGLDGERQQANAIYDMENYADVYWRDIGAAKAEVIVSSPRLNTEKVNRMIRTLQTRQEMGVKVVIVTWHPDAYKYGRDDTRMELMERLRKAGFEIRLVEETCEHFAVIDREIVWYGSMNLLSKEDAEDNLMRVCSKDIAAELLELTFGKDKDLQSW
jgi:superfamily II DNA or RNA helicase